MTGKHERLKNKGRPVKQYTISGEYVATYPSAKRASEIVTTANRSYITQCCKGLRQTSGGFMWTYEGNSAPTYKHKDHHYVRQFDMQRQLIATHISVTHAAKSVGLSVHAISCACRGHSKTAGGYIWEYVT